MHTPTEIELLEALRRIEVRSQELADRGGKVDALDCGGLAEEARSAIKKVTP